MISYKANGHPRILWEVKYIKDHGLKPERAECEPGTWVPILNEKVNCPHCGNPVPHFSKEYLHDLKGKPYIDGLIPIFINPDIPSGVVRYGDQFEITDMEFVKL